MLQSDITILDELVAVNLSVSIWSARKRMLPEDFGGAELPPDDLSSLGSNRVADPEKLRIFSTFKARTHTMLDRTGVRFLSGWALPESKTSSVIEELNNMHKEFSDSKAEFLAEHDQSLEDWIARHGAWANIIRNSTVSSDYVRSRLDFNWQIFKVAPLTQQADAVQNSSLSEEVANLGNTLFDEIAKYADEVWRKVYCNRIEITHKALSPLRTLLEKLRGLAFVEPHVMPVADLIAASLARIPGKGVIAGTDLLMLQGLVGLLRNTEALLKQAQSIFESNELSSTLELLSKLPQPGEPLVKNSICANEVDKELPIFDVPARHPQLASYGLW